MVQIEFIGVVKHMDRVGCRSPETPISRNIYTRFIKWLLDVMFSAIGLVLSIPLFVIAAGVIKISSRGPVFFVQERVGKLGQIFVIYKFRTMCLETDNNGRRLSDSERMTKTGRLLRNLSIDELPQLINILKGEMSFIGPRPLLVKYLPYYTYEEMQRHSIKPGITGWAQVNGRNAISWEDKFKYDLDYVKDISFLLDLWILALTLYKVFKRADVINNDLESLDLERKESNEQ
jgi:lipopolysaccharide/colanic/teichoic acid biosynthesis glycosyltransferase